MRRVAGGLAACRRRGLSRDRARLTEAFAAGRDARPFFVLAVRAIFALWPNHAAATHASGVVRDMSDSYMDRDSAGGGDLGRGRRSFCPKVHRREAKIASAEEAARKMVGRGSGRPMTIQREARVELKDEMHNLRTQTEA